MLPFTFIPSPGSSYRQQSSSVNHLPQILEMDEHTTPRAQLSQLPTEDNFRHLSGPFPTTHYRGAGLNTMLATTMLPSPTTPSHIPHTLQEAFYAPTTPISPISNTRASEVSPTSPFSTLTTSAVVRTERPKKQIDYSALPREERLNAFAQTVLYHVKKNEALKNVFLEFISSRGFNHAPTLIIRQLKEFLLQNTAHTGKYYQERKYTQHVDQPDKQEFINQVLLQALKEWYEENSRRVRSLASASLQRNIRS